MHTHVDLACRWQRYVSRLAVSSASQTGGLAVSHKQQEREELPCLSRPCLAACTSKDPAGALTSQSQHWGFIRTAADPASVTAQEVFQEVSILVDSGSQQEPFCSTVIAQSLGAKGSLSSYVMQAGCQPLPIYNVGWCDLGINGKSCRTRFKSASVSPFGIHGSVEDTKLSTNKQHTLSHTLFWASPVFVSIEVYWITLTTTSGRRMLKVISGL